MAHQNPDYNLIAQSLTALAGQVTLVATAPLPPAQQQLQQQLQQLQQQNQQQNQQMQNQFQQMQVQVQQQIQQMQNQFQQQMQQMQNQFQQQIQQMQVQIQQQVQQVINGQNRLLADAELLPLRLQNANASQEAPLRYPPGVALPAHPPTTKEQLLTLTVPNCQTLATALVLPALPGQPTVVQRRQQLLDYLGCGIRAY
ncbi:hypothetical protein BKA93DRAFT_809574 [Sparassis latifolia]